MEAVLETIKVNFETIQFSDDGNQFQITIQIPMKLGWIGNVKFILDENNETTMNYCGQGNGMAFFETNVYLPTKAIYHYYFSWQANGQTMYLKKKNQNVFTAPSLDEKFKLSVNFDVPEWAKGKVMYHIFVDRFRRGSDEPMQEMPRRKIHHSWDEEMIIGPDENGIWNNDFYGGDLKGIKQQLPYLKSLGVDI